MSCAGVALVPVGLKRMVDASNRRRSRTSLAGVTLRQVRDEPRVLRFVLMNHLIGRDPLFPCKATEPLRQDPLPRPERAFGNLNSLDKSKRFGSHGGLT